MDVKKMAEMMSAQLLLLDKLQIAMELETDALSEINLDKLHEINNQKDELSAEMKITGAALRQAMTEQALKSGMPSDSTLGAIVAVIGTPEISALHSSLNLKAERVRNITLVNREIAERFAETASSTLNILTGLINQTSVYGASGSYQQRPTGSIMINREA